MAAQRVTIESGDLLTVPQVAKILGVHFTTVYRWIEAGAILSAKFGGIVFVPKSEVERKKKIIRATAAKP